MIVTCKCGQRMEAPDDAAGRQGVCVQCGRRLRIRKPRKRIRWPIAPTRANIIIGSVAVAVFISPLGLAFFAGRATEDRAAPATVKTSKPAVHKPATTAPVKATKKPRPKPKPTILELLEEEAKTLAAIDGNSQNASAYQAILERLSQRFPDTSPFYLGEYIRVTRFTLEDNYDRSYSAMRILQEVDKCGTTCHITDQPASFVDIMISVQSKLARQPETFLEHRERVDRSWEMNWDFRNNKPTMIGELYLRSVAGRIEEMQLSK